MPHQFSTGQAASLLHTTEPRLNDLIRRRRILPPPDVVAGRRAWSRGHILQAAMRLGLDLAAVQELLGADGSTATPTILDAERAGGGR